MYASLLAIQAHMRTNKHIRMQEPKEWVQMSDVRLGGLSSTLLNKDAEPSCYLACFVKTFAAEQKARYAVGINQRSTQT